MFIFIWEQLSGEQIFDELRERRDLLDQYL